MTKRVRKLGSSGDSPGTETSKVATKTMEHQLAEQRLVEAKGTIEELRARIVELETEKRKVSKDPSTVAHGLRLELEEKKAEIERLKTERKLRFRDGDPVRWVRFSERDGKTVHHGIVKGTEVEEREVCHVHVEGTHAEARVVLPAEDLIDELDGVFDSSRPSNGSKLELG